MKHGGDVKHGHETWGSDEKLGGGDVKQGYETWWR